VATKMTMMITTAPVKRISDIKLHWQMLELCIYYRCDSVEEIVLYEQ